MFVYKKIVSNSLKFYNYSFLISLKRKLKKNLFTHFSNNLLVSKFDIVKTLPTKLKVTFRKRNTFFVLTDSKNFILESTTIRRQGFYGRRRRQYTAMQGTLRKLKKYLKFLFIDDLEVTFIGSNRFRFILRKVFRKREGKFKFSRYKTVLKPKVPHNGTKRQKSKNRRKLK